MSAALAALEVALLATPALPAGRLVADRRLQRLFPRVHATLGLATAGWLAGLVLLALHERTALHVLAGLALPLLGALAWRSRAGYGRGLPPGSLSPFRSIAALADRDFYRRQAARHGPVFKMAQFHQGVVCVVGLDRGHALLRERAEALGPAVQPFTHEIAGGFLRYMDDATHDLYGGLFRKALAAPIVAAAEPEIAAVCRRELAALAGAADGGAAPPGPALRRVAHAAFARVLFGLEPGTADAAELDRLYPGLAAQPLSSRLTPAARSALAGLRELLAARSRRWRSGAELPPACALAELARLDARMPDAACHDNLLFIHRIATQNVESLLNWLVAIVGAEPEWRRRLAASLVAPPPPSGPPLADRMVMETLRLAQSEYLYRRIERETEWRGHRLPAGWQLRVCVWESHRDPEVFSDPERFDPDRFLAADIGRARYSPFGFARHACNGVPLANAVARSLLRELAARYDWSVNAAGGPERDFRHWSHWRPSARLQLVLRPLEPAAARATP